MRCGKREKKMLHEHEAFLFTFTIVFLLGGFIFWGYNADAVEYFVDGKTISTENQFYTLTGEEKVVDLVLRNSVPVGEVDMAVVIYDVDVQCEIISDVFEVEEEIPEEDEEEVELEDLDIDEGIEEVLDDCKYFDVNLPTSLTFYPGEIVTIGINFHSEEILEAILVLNVVTNKDIDSFTFNFRAVDEIPEEVEEEVEEEIPEEVEEIDVPVKNPLVELIMKTLGLIEEDSEIYLKEALLHVDDLSGLGFTQSSLNFGPLNIEDNEQKTKRVGIENLVIETVEILEIIKPEGMIVTPAHVTLEMGEMAYFEITCAPLAEGEIPREVVFKTNKGDVSLKIFCNGVKGEERIVDEISPIVTILKPSEGKISKVFDVSIEAFDEGNILEVAVLKIYFGSSLIRRLVEPTDSENNLYEFEFDASGFSGIRELYAVAVDHAGNEGFSKKVSLWLDEDLVTEEIKEKPEYFVFKMHSGEDIVDVDEGAITASGKSDLIVHYGTEEAGDFRFEFKGSDIGNVGGILLGEEDFNIRAYDGGQTVGISDEKLKEIIETLEVESIVMPMFKPSGYISGDAVDVSYLHEDLTSFRISSEDVLSIFEEGELLYVEINTGALFGI